MDDASTDGGPAIAAAWRDRLGDRVRLLQHPGRAWMGTAASRNLGMREARGRYLAFLDADDAYEPEYLARHVSQLERDSALDVVLSAVRYWWSWQPAGCDQVIGHPVDPRRRVAPPALIVATLLTRSAPMPATCGITFRRAAWQRLGEVPEEFHGHYEDQVLVCMLLLSCTALVLDECLARYRQHPGSLTEANAPRGREPGSAAFLARRRFLEWLAGYVRERRLQVPELDAWIAGQNRTMERLARGTPGVSKRPPGTALRAATARVLQRLAPGLAEWARRGQARLLRRQVMRRIESLERAGRASAP